MKTWGLITGFTLTLLLYSLCCCVPDPVILNGDIGGYVTDSDTNEPIKDATIRLDPSSDSTTTGDEGEYLFENIAANFYEIEASKSTYKTVSKDIDVEPAVYTELSFELSKSEDPIISPPFLDFCIDESNLHFTITNAGSGTFSYSIAPSQDWITLSHTSGAVASEIDTIIVTIDRSGLSDELIMGKIYITFSFNDSDDIHESVDIFVNGVVDLETNHLRVVEIGMQIWMAENLNIGSMAVLNQSMPQDNNGIIEKFCYDDDESNCDIFGGLYIWAESMMMIYPPDTEITGNIQGICPDGWHLPTEEDVNILAETLGGWEIAGGKLKDTTLLWEQPNLGANNESGFGGLPAGYVGYTEEYGYEFYGLGSEGYIPISNVYFNDDAQQYWVMVAIYNKQGEELIYNTGPIPEFVAIPARCIKDP